MPTSPRPYQNQSIKNKNSQSIFKKQKSFVTQEILEEERKERLKKWITFFRRNPHRFIMDYFGIHLHIYQILMVWVLQRSSLAYIVASRASAKTWIIAVWSCALAVLYPGIKIIVCAKTLKQGGIIISEKIMQLRKEHHNLEREIESITANPNTYECIFHNGSTIRVVPSSESARGNRANYIIVEESRLVPKEILEGVIKPFLETRNPPYKNNPKYANDQRLQEEGTISYITSSWYTMEYWYTYVQTCIKRMNSGDETANFLAFDYLISLHHGIKTKSMLKNEMEDADPLTVQMEYLNIPSGSSGKSYFKSTLFKRNIKQAFYPQKEDNFNAKKNPYGLPKTTGEIRFVSCDIATRANKANDNSIIECVRALPLIGVGYRRQLVYGESHKGSHAGEQAKRLKRVFYDFEADYMVLDVQSAGIGIFDFLSEETIDEERGIVYPAMTVVDEYFSIIKQDAREDLRKNHTRGLEAKPIIFPITASQAMNSDIAVSFRSLLQRRMWEFLIPESEGEEYLLKKNKEFLSDPDDSYLRGFFLNPYVQTGLLIGECINLDMKPVNGLIKLVEKPGSYKDRYSTISYVNYVIAKEFDIELVKQKEDKDDLEAMVALSYW